MFEFEPQIYITIYYFALLALVLAFSTNTQLRPSANKVYAVVALLIVVLHITFRPVTPQFGDTMNYARGYLNGDFTFSELNSVSDFGWYLYSLLMAPLKNITLYFGGACLMYVLPVYFAFRKDYPRFNAVIFILFVCSFSFWGFGVNGLRNGIATSFLIFAFYNYKNWKYMLIWLMLAYSMHSSSLLPIAAFLITYKYTNSKSLLYVWLASFVLSFVIGPSISNVIESLDMFSSDDRFSSYLGSTAAEYDDGAGFSSIGFRFDFFIYSAIPVYYGYRYLKGLGKTDGFYRRIFNTYLICNTFWLFCVYVPYNNRFAYLSWFLYPIMLAHPIITMHQQNPDAYPYKKVIPYVLINYAFTFFMHFR